MPLNLAVPPRFVGSLPFKDGPIVGVFHAHDMKMKDRFHARKWDHGTAQPSRDRLMELGLDDIAEDLDSRG